MTFVYPLLLAGLLLAAAPVILHFIVRRQPTLLLFPAFRFLIQKRRSNTRNLRLKHVLLLLLRVALIVLVCLALARPRLFHEAIGISREKPIALVLIFDTSPSMDYKASDMTRLDLAKKRALELLDQLPDGGRVLLLDTGEAAEFARADWLKSLDAARQKIQSLTIHPSSVPVTKALEEAQRRLDEWDRTGSDPAGQALPRFVCIFSDRTKASWDANASKRPPREDAPSVKAFYFDVGVDEPVDVAITAAELPADRQSFADGDKFPLRVVVQATGKNAENTLLVQVGKKLIQQPFAVEAGKAQAITLDIETDGLGPGFHQAEIKLETTVDALNFNNARHLTFGIHARQKVLVLADDLARTRRLANALSALLYAVDHHKPDEKIDLARYDAVFLASVAAPSDTLWNALAAYVKAGGGVAIVPPGDELQPQRYRSDAARTVLPAKLVKPIESAGAQWNLAASDLQHSFLAQFTRWFADGWDVGRYPARATRYWLVEPVDKKDVVVRYDEHPAVVIRKTNGKVLLLTTPMDERKPAWNDYGESLTSFYLALTLMCAQQLCPEPATAPLNFQFGQDAPRIQRPAAAVFARYQLTSGAFSEQIRFDERNLWIGDRLPRAGSYTISGSNQEDGAATPISRFSINVPAEESDLTRVPTADIEAVLGADTIIPQDRHTPLRDTLTWDEPMELFPWLMIAALFLLALENLLANRFYRQESSTGSEV